MWFFNLLVLKQCFLNQNPFHKIAMCVFSIIFFFHFLSVAIIDFQETWPQFRRSGCSSTWSLALSYPSVLQGLRYPPQSARLRRGLAPGASRASSQGGGPNGEDRSADTSGMEGTDAWNMEKKLYMLLHFWILGVRFTVERLVFSFKIWIRSHILWSYIITVKDMVLHPVFASPFRIFTF